MAQGYGRQELYEELTVYIPLTLLALDISFAHFISLFPEACKNRKHLLELCLRNQRGKDIVSLAEFEAGVKIEESIKVGLKQEHERGDLLTEDLH